MQAQTDRWRWGCCLIAFVLAIATAPVCGEAHAQTGVGACPEPFCSGASAAGCARPDGGAVDPDAHPESPATGADAHDCGCPCICHTPAVACAATCLRVTPTRAWLPAEPSASREARIPEPFERPPRFLA